jgi:5-methylcytosine-specific restriction endonuclease McrBC GTP-binding regulatory subunit McrB
MNLAHPELYFAEFLSKLEQRRGSTAGNIPKIDVKVGAGMKPYELTLGRNVLWVGTMNEDETTKSLSDKVLDRATVIYFPRPNKLSSRPELKTLNSENRGSELPRQLWQDWKMSRVSFSDEEIGPYRSFVEKINHHLSIVGRAVGHRVWQSIEYYMANYPDVLANNGSAPEKMKAMHTAFEDQIAQKIMPKLRGIDTRGSSLSKCLEPIRGLIQDGVQGIPFDLLTDFDRSMELGYGQFMWKSADYLKDRAESEPS